MVDTRSQIMGTPAILSVYKDSVFSQYLNIIYVYVLLNYFLYKVYKLDFTNIGAPRPNVLRLVVTNSV